jgi:methylthioribose-1-phosphate isomerase
MLPATLQWIGETDGHLRLIDQTQLPAELAMLDCRDVASVWHAIKRLSVRGAPAIGISAAYGVVIAAGRTDATIGSVRQAIDYLATSRPTAVNLFWALDRMRHRVEQGNDDPDAPISDRLREGLLTEATAIHDEDRQLCHRMGEYGAPLIEGCRGVLTHCNAGALATSEWGTALGVIYSAHQHNPQLRVFADETRPLLQGARLTAWELQRSGVDVTVICDSMAAQVMREGKVQAVVVGADRVAANGDAANKIGTYATAIAARYHGIPFYVVAPHSTFDLTLASGEEIPIEQRERDEIALPFGRPTVPDEVPVYNPAFDVTPASLIAAIITDRGVIESPDTAAVARVIGSPVAGV